MAHPRSGDRVKVHYTGRFADGRVFDSSRGREPLELIVGEGQVIPGFENAVTRLQQGEEATVTIPAEEAYGQRREELMISVDRAQFPPHIEPSVGQRLQVRQDDGEVAVLTVTDVSAGEVTLDANHPLAGEDLTFELELVDIEPSRQP